MKRITCRKSKIQKVYISVQERFNSTYDGPQWSLLFWNCLLLFQEIYFSSKCLTSLPSYFHFSSELFSLLFRAIFEWPIEYKNDYFLAKLVESRRFIWLVNLVCRVDVHMAWGLACLLHWRDLFIANYETVKKKHPSGNNHRRS